LIRGIASHSLVARSYRVNFTSVIQVVVHIWTRWFEVIIIGIVNCCLSPLLGRQPCLLFKKLIICPAHLVPVLVCRFQYLNSLLEMSFLFYELLNLNKGIFASILF
jgi:hypothetical protein